MVTKEEARNIGYSWTCHSLLMTTDLLTAMLENQEKFGGGADEEVWIEFCPLMQYIHYRGPVLL